MTALLRVAVVFLHILLMREGLHTLHTEAGGTHKLLIARYGVVVPDFLVQQQEEFVLEVIAG
jgi:hypothetical protein